MKIITFVENIFFLSKIMIQTPVDLIVLPIKTYILDAKKKFIKKFDEYALSS